MSVTSIHVITHRPIYAGVCYKRKSMETASWFLQLIMVERLVVVAASATSSLVHLGGDGVRDVRELLLLLLEILCSSLGGVLFEPILGLLDGIEEL